MLAGCDDRKVAKVPAKVVSPGSASVHGTVKLTGKAPEVAKIDNSICTHAGPIADESVLVGSNGGLANVVVSITGVRSPSGPPAEPVVLDQKDCRFVPHVVAVKAGQALRIKNSDAEAHNVHANPAANASFNVALTVPGSSKDMSFTEAEIFRVKCDVHPWMTCYVGVFDSDYFAVTDADGRFEIKGLPPGSYELAAWHERYGELKQTIEVSNGPLEANFAYEPPK